MNEAALEAVLFAAAKPLSIATLANILEVTENEVKGMVKDLTEQLDVAHRGIQVRVSGAGVELITNTAYGDIVGRMRKQEDNLSSAAMETLAIIAFKQPVTKAEIEEMRGVNSERIIKQLVSRELVCELGHKDTIGRPILYGTTTEFLRILGITSLDELPIHQDISE